MFLCHRSGLTFSARLTQLTDSQLVVVGDQSSGKSSLLEGLTGLNFPIASELCTRFATQIVLRRAAESAARVSILPGPAANEDAEQRARLLAFSRSLDDANLTATVFAEILDEAGYFRHIA